MSLQFPFQGIVAPPPNPSSYQIAPGLLSNLTQDFFQGNQAQNQMAQRNAFAGGVPTNPDGTPNYSQMGNTMFQLGNPQTGLELSQMGAAQKGLLGGLIGGGAGVPMVGEGAVPSAGASTGTTNTVAQPSSDYYTTLTQSNLESGGNPNAVNKTTGAYGISQIIPSTWAGIRANRPDLNLPADMTQSSEADQMAATQALTQANAEGLQSAGIPVNDRTLAMAHFLGLGGAREFFSALQQNPGANAASIFPAAAKANAAIFGNGNASLAQVFGNYAGRFGTGNTAGGGAAPIYAGQPGGSVPAQYAGNPNTPALSPNSQIAANQAQPAAQKLSVPPAPTPPAQRRSYAENMANEPSIAARAGNTGQPNQAQQAETANEPSIIARAGQAGQPQQQQSQGLVADFQRNLGKLIGGGNQPTAVAKNTPPAAPNASPPVLTAAAPPAGANAPAPGAEPAGGVVGPQEANGQNSPARVAAAVELARVKAASQGQTQVQGQQPQSQGQAQGGDNAGFVTPGASGAQTPEKQLGLDPTYSHLVPRTWIAGGGTAGDYAQRLRAVAQAQLARGNQLAASAAMIPGVGGAMARAQAVGLQGQANANIGQAEALEGMIKQRDEEATQIQGAGIKAAETAGATQSAETQGINQRAINTESQKQADFQMSRQVGKQRLAQLADLAEHFTTGPLSESYAEAQAISQQLGLGDLGGPQNFAANYQVFMKNAVKSVFSDVKDMGGRVLASEIMGLTRGNVAPNMQPAAVQEILEQSAGLLNQSDKYFKDFQQWRRSPASRGPDGVGGFVSDWVGNQDNSPEKFQGAVHGKIAAMGNPETTLAPTTKPEVGRVYQTPYGVRQWDGKNWNKAGSSYQRLFGGNGAQ